MEEQQVRDGYKEFFDEFQITKKELFAFGIKNTIYAPPKTAAVYWDQLKDRVYNNQSVYIRAFGGKSSKGRNLYKHFYKHVLENENVKIDATNNTEPKKLMQVLTGYSSKETPKTKHIQNYQTSHIFGRTKNVFAFTAPWNLVYLPKIMDPLMGHEARGKIVDEYIALFRKKSFKRFQPLIEDFNKQMRKRKFKKAIEAYLLKIAYYVPVKEDREKLIKSIEEEFQPIQY